jgi:hypothetical protein
MNWMQVLCAWKSGQISVGFFSLKVRDYTVALATHSNMESGRGTGHLLRIILWNKVSTMLGPVL